MPEFSSLPDQIKEDFELPCCIIILAYPHRWEHHLVRKLSLKFNVVSIVYFDNCLQEMGYYNFLGHVCSIIEVQQAQFVFLCFDFFTVIDVKFIRKLPDRVKKVLLTLDDIVLHEVNSINASACDFVLSADPVSVLKYLEKGIDAEYIALEGSSAIYNNEKIKKDIDVLFFGLQDKADRKLYLSYLKNKGINITVVGGGNDGSQFLTPLELAEYISRSKIVLNFSKTDNMQETKSYKRIYGNLINSFYPFEYYMQLKGRVIEAALCKAACVSEDAPGIRLLFPDNEVSLFRSPEECLNIIMELLADETKRELLAERLYIKTYENYEDIAQMNKLFIILKYLKKRKKSTINIPFWYFNLSLKAQLKFLNRFSLLKAPHKLLKEALFLLPDKNEVSRSGYIFLITIIVLYVLSFFPRRLLFKMKTLLKFICGSRVIINFI